MRIATMILAMALSSPAAAGPEQVQIDAGLRWFKHSAAQPNELAGTQVFDRWEALNANSAGYEVTAYKPLEPLYFNMTFGADLLFRFRNNIMLKVGYDYSNPFGIGGHGRIAYTDLATGTDVVEVKRFSYTSHQITTFVGPIVTVGEDDRADIYLGFSPMAPTFVTYKEHYHRSERGRTVDEIDHTWNGFFGSCRALTGIQVRVNKRFMLGSEGVFAFLNYMPLESDGITNSSFRFPTMMWNVTARYQLR